MSSTPPGSTIIGVAVAILCLLAVPGGVAAAADGALETAREELRLRVETERRMRQDFETLLAAGQMNATEVADFEDYLVRLGMSVDQQRRAVAKLGADGLQAGTAEPLPKDFDRGQTDGEKIALLDAELGNSLSGFDEKLLREQQEIAAKSRASSTGNDAENRDGAPRGTAEGEGENQGENSAAEAEGKDGKSGGESAEGESGTGSASEPPGETGEQADQADQGKPGSGSDEGSDQVASAGGPGSPGSESGATNTPPDIGDGKDDDIVARQLREAAESEQDPELREKLWDEYRRYKSGTR